MKSEKHRIENLLNLGLFLSLSLSLEIPPSRTRYAKWNPVIFSFCSSSMGLLLYWENESERLYFTGYNLLFIISFCSYGMTMECGSVQALTPNAFTSLQLFVIIMSLL